MGDQLQKRPEGEVGEIANQGQAQRRGDSSSMLGTAASALGPGALQRKIIQRRERNQAGAAPAPGVEQAEHEGHEGGDTAVAPGAEHHEEGATDVLQRPSVLPQVHRDKKHQITKKKGKMELNVP